MQNETESVVSIAGNLDRKASHQRTVETSNCFPEVGFELLSVQYVYQCADQEESVLFSSKIGLAVITRVFASGLDISVIQLFLIFRTRSRFC